MEYVIGALWSGLDLFGCFLLHGAFLPQRDLNKRYVPKILAIWIFCCIYTNIPMNQYVKLVLSVTVYTVLSVLLLQGAVSVHILQAVKYILNRLEAEYTFAYCDGWFQFVAEIQE